jgi:hypothetical protein
MFAIIGAEVITGSGGLNGPKWAVDVPVPVSDGSLVDAGVRQYARQ